MTSTPSAVGHITIGASPAEVFAVVGDPLAMARLGAEVHEARWLDGATSPAVGARFRGINRNGPRRWSTVCRVTDFEPGRRFGYDVTVEVGSVVRMPISRWQYDLEPTDAGCLLTESNWIRTPTWLATLTGPVTGRPDRLAANQSHIELTLQRVGELLESRAASGSLSESAGL
jgi:hypothetical protein